MRGRSAGGRGAGATATRAMATGTTATGTTATLAVLAALLLGSSSAWARKPGATPPTPERGAGHAAMVERLRNVAQETDDHLNPYANGARARHLTSVEVPADPISRAKQQLALGTELIFAGDTLDGLRVLEDLRAQGGGEHLGSSLDAALALGHLRRGEQENCILAHNADACLVPIRGEGVHRAPAGSRAAIEIYLRMLEQHPEDLTLRWLLNLAYMTLGEHPEQVPERYLVPPEVFRPEQEMPRYHDVAPRLGLDARGLAGGVVLDDLDRDGDLDLLVSSWGRRDPLRLFLRRSDGSFEERVEEAGLGGITGGLNLVQGDVDDDGQLDIFVPRGSWLGPYGRHPNSLLRNRGDGTFEDVTEVSGLLSFRPTQTAAFADFDRDGDLDLFVGNETWREARHPCELFLNRGDGTFEEVAELAGLDNTGFVKGVAVGDMDGDGWPDLYLSQLGQPNVLYRNLGVGGSGEGEEIGPPRFEDVTAAAGVSEPINSFPTWFFDADNDGDLDLFVSGYGPRAASSAQYSWEAYQNATGHVAADYLLLPTFGETPRLYLNRGDGTFTDATARTGLDRVLYTMGANFGDVDNDGFLDLYLATGETRLEALMPNRLFRNQGGRRFLDVTTSTHTGHIQKGHGVAFGDVDRDGDQDLYAVMGGAFEGDPYQNVLFENPGWAEHRWITLVLEGTTSSRDAQGAWVRVRLRTPEGPREVYRVVGSGGSFGASSLQLEIGLGNATAIEAVEVRWPAGEVEGFEGLGLDAAFRLLEGSGRAPRG
ncbi:MAG: CRTAC1 family protein [Holophagales bacterium]|nr:CRTAC1 family protein [Holophagales bacterium]